MKLFKVGDIIELRGEGILVNQGKWIVISEDGFKYGLLFVSSKHYVFSVYNQSTIEKMCELIED